MAYSASTSSRCSSHRKSDPFRHPALAREPAENRDAHGRMILHIDGAAAPHAALGELGRKRWILPALGLGLHHIKMRREKERSLLSRPFQTRNDISAAGITL